jgi:hypothetical protein
MAVRLTALRAGRHLPPGRSLVLISLRGWVDPGTIVRLEGLGKLKNPVTSGIEPSTLRLVTWCLNQLRDRVPRANFGKSRWCQISMKFYAAVELSHTDYTTKLMSADLQLFVANQPETRGRDSSVGIATGYGLDDRVVGVRVPVGSRIFSFHVVQTGYGVHPPS